MISLTRPGTRPNLNPTLQFMNQLFANKNDYGKGRNMPVHYMSEKLRLVGTLARCLNRSTANSIKHPISSPLATQIPHGSFSPSHSY